jgi:hypothetical protein
MTASGARGAGSPWLGVFTGRAGAQVPPAAAGAIETTQQVLHERSSVEHATEKLIHGAANFESRHGRPLPWRAAKHRALGQISVSPIQAEGVITSAGSGIYSLALRLRARSVFAVVCGAGFFFCDARAGPRSY